MIFMPGLFRFKSDLLLRSGSPCGNHFFVVCRIRWHMFQLACYSYLTGWLRDCHTAFLLSVFVDHLDGLLSVFNTLYFLLFFQIVRPCSTMFDIRIYLTENCFANKLSRSSVGLLKEYHLLHACKERQRNFYSGSSH